MNANVVIPNSTNLRLVVIDGHVSTDPKEPMLSQTSYPIVGWRLTENDVVPLLPRLVHVPADIDPDESGGVIRWSYLHDPMTGGLYDAHSGRHLGETLDEAMESAELLLFGLSTGTWPAQATARWRDLRLTDGAAGAVVCCRGEARLEQQ